MGRGYVDAASGTGNESRNTGDTDGLGNRSGMASGTNGLIGINYRGIENFWGNTWEWVDGINIKADYNPWIADHGFASDTFTAPYEDTGLTLLSSSDVYYSDIHFDSDNNFFYLPKKTGGSSDSHFYDNYWINTRNRVVRAGGPWTADSRAGLFAWHLTYSSADSFRNHGSRALLWIETEDVTEL